MSYLGGSMPRNTSNADYGRFHFDRMSKNQPNGEMSSNGNRMVQHVHYPNCPNGIPGPQTFREGNKQYTVEYGEDAVRAALGGQYPDFQAEFQKQYGNGGAGDAGEAVNPQVMQAMGDGNSKVAMIPVVMADEEGNEQAVNPKQTDATPTGEQEETQNPAPNEESCKQESSPTVLPITTNRETITNAYEQARKARSKGPIKYGRHIRPSFAKADGANLCRRKNSVQQNPTPTPDAPQQSSSEGQQYDYMGMGQAPCQEMGALDLNGNEGYYPQQGHMAFGGPQYQPQQQQIQQYQEQQQMASPTERGRSLPPRRTGRPEYSLCGKCKKCRNLRSESSNPSVLTFPMYSSSGSRKNLPQMMTSSNLGQSAKNFRAIRFSSYHM